MSAMVLLGDGWYHRGFKNTNLYGPFALHAEAEAAFEASKAAIEGRDKVLGSKFARKSNLLHVKSQSVYKILETPAKARVEATGEPAYFYEASDGTVWARSQLEMEDGRFIPAEDGPKVDDKTEEHSRVIVCCQLGTFRMDRKEGVDLMLVFNAKDGWELRETGSDQPDSQHWLAGAKSTEPFMLTVGNKLVAINEAGQKAFRSELAELSLIEHDEWNSQMNWAYHSGKRSSLDEDQNRAASSHPAMEAPYGCKHASEDEPRYMVSGGMGTGLKITPMPKPDA